MKTTKKDFTEYIHELRKEKKQQLVIRNTQVVAWNSGLTEWLHENFECRPISLNGGDDFVCYLNNFRR